MEKGTPPSGKYIDDERELPKEIKQINTSVPVFIGYTLKCGSLSSPIAKREIHSVFVSEAKRIESLEEYEMFFGTGPDESVTVKIGKTLARLSGNNEEAYNISCIQAPMVHTMYYHLQMYFANGGAACYVISVGNTDVKTVNCNHLLAGLQMARLFEEIAILVIPQLIHLSPPEASLVYRAMLEQAGELNRFAILDCYDNDHPFDIRGAAGEKYLSYGAAYHPYIKTSLPLKYDLSKLEIIFSGDSSNDSAMNSFESLPSGLQSLVLEEMQKLSPVLPPSSAIAGIYGKTDRVKGVWSAPANVEVLRVCNPTIEVKNEEQPQFITKTPDGKSINLIRYFQGKGVLVIGGRTLTGNDPQWKFVSMRRLFNMIEESISRSTRPFIFRKNDAITWVGIQALIENYLMTLWYAGILQGSQPEHAFFVKVGLGETMTTKDIGEGNLIIEVGVAPVIPGEFVDFKIVHKMG